MVVTGTSCVTTFGTQTFLQTVRVAIAEADADAEAGAAQPQPALAAGAAQPQPDEAAGAAHPQPEAAGAAQPHPEEAATPHPLATGTSSVTFWYEPISLVTVFMVVTGNERQTWRVPVFCSV